MAQQRKRKTRQRAGAVSPARRPATEAAPPAGAPAATATATATAARPQTFEERYRERSEARNAAVREGLEPLAPGEQPWPLLAAIVLTMLSGVANLVLYAAGVKIRGGHSEGPEIVVFSLLMIGCSIGMWRHWYQAVLAFMALLGIIIVLFSLFLVEASNLLGFIVAPVVVIVAGTLFWKLVRVLSRLQMPERAPRR